MRSSRENDEVTAFVRAKYGHLLRTAYLLCGDQGKAEDLVLAAAFRKHRYCVRRVLANTYVSWRAAAPGGNSLSARQAP